MAMDWERRKVANAEEATKMCNGEKKIHTYITMPIYEKPAFLAIRVWGRGGSRFSNVRTILFLRSIVACAYFCTSMPDYNSMRASIAWPYCHARTWKEVQKCSLCDGLLLKSIRFSCCLFSPWQSSPCSAGLFLCIHLIPRDNIP